MKTTFTLSTLAAAMALASTAHALSPVATKAIPQANRLYVSGATATDQALINLSILSTANGLCASGTVDLYVAKDAPDTMTPGQFRNFDDLLVSCTGRTGRAFSGQAIALFKRASGSGGGSTSLANEDFQQFIDADTAAANLGCDALDAADSVSLGSPFLNFTVHRNCDITTTTKRANAGIADVEPPLLYPFAKQPKLDSQALAQVTFAPIVSTGLYRVLQQDQGKEFDCATDNNGIDDGDGYPDCDEEINVPSMNTTTVRGIMTGDLIFWSDITDSTGASLVNAASDTLFVCRRGNHSGTEATFREFYTKQQCSPGNVGLVRPDDLSCENGGCDYVESTFHPSLGSGDRVVASTGSTDVLECVDAISELGGWAIGVSSTEKRWTTANANANDWRYVGQDGFAPTLHNYIGGGQTLFSEDVFNRIKVGQNTNADARPGATANQVADAILQFIGDKDVLAAVDVGFREPSGDYGLLAIPNPGVIDPDTAPYTQAKARSNPVNAFKRSAGATVNNCNDPRGVSYGSVASDAVSAVTP